MPPVLLDTDVLSELLKGVNTNVVQRGQAYWEEFGTFTFSSVTVYEIVRGLKEKDARNQLQHALAWFAKNDEIVPLAADYLAAGHVIAQAKRMGRIVHLPDALIACSSARLKLTLVTGNTSDFEAIQQAGLAIQIENWR